MSCLRFEFRAGGLFLPRLGLWLDPHEPQTGPEQVFVSHAHSDHVAAHREIILSAPTARLMQARVPGTRCEHVLPFGQPGSFSKGAAPFQLTLLPAGHIFGSAMALVEADGQSLLYTGDFKLRPSLSAEQCEPRPADILIMETTFGRPQYVFPPTDAVLKGVVRFCREALDNEETPVLLGYSLGKSQELLCGLADAGLPLMLHGAVHKLTKIYEQFGQCFPRYEPYAAGHARGKVLVCPPHVTNPTMLRQIGRTRTAILTGWAVDPHSRYRYGCDAAFPLSDHADFTQLLEMVKRVGPKQVYTLHGFAADFAQTLRELGYDAQALSQDEQYALPLLQGATSSRQPASIRPLASKGSKALPNTSDGTKAAKTGDISLSSSGGEGQGEEVPASGTSAVGGPSQPANSFLAFATTCSRIAADARKLEKTRLLAEYVRGLQSDAVALAATWFSGRPFPASQNRVLQIGWAVLCDALCAAAGLQRADFHQVYLKHSDLGETALEVLQHHRAQPTLSVEQVNALFQQLHAARGPLAKAPMLKAALAQCTPLEAKYLVKIITGDLRIGLKEGLVEDAVAIAFGQPPEAVRQATLLVGDIGETARLASENRLGEATLVPFRPIKLMLAFPEETAAGVWERMSAPGTVWLEDKYDGIRCQLHKVGQKVTLFSRDLKDITNTFPELADSLLSLPADFILDGEIVAMRGEEVLPFAELQKRLGRRQGDLFMREEVPIQYVAFDLLWLGGGSRLERSLTERRAELESLAGQRRAGVRPSPGAASSERSSALEHSGSIRLTDVAAPGDGSTPSTACFRLVHITQARSVEDIEAAFTAARSRGNEGLMIKNPASVYTPGRRGQAWLKLKKAYATLDCVVVGAEYGHGKRSQVLSDYTFSVRDDQTGELKTIGKAYSGLTDAEIAQLTEHFLKTATRQHGRYFEVPPDTVLEIAFDRIQPSKRHSSGLALRFPRIVRIRTDKSPAEIDTLATARQLAGGNGRS